MKNINPKTISNRFLVVLFILLIYVIIVFAANPGIGNIILNTTNIQSNSTNQNLTAYANITDADGG